MTSQDEPVHLVEDEDTGDRFLVFGTDRGAQLDIRFEGETLWMTQAQIADLFAKDRTSVTKHIVNIFGEGELDEKTSVKKVHISMGRPVTLYNLDVVISVGYRVSSAQATLFRRWATGVLVQFAKKGFVVDSVRLKSPENTDRLKELREIIRDIRSDEANVYRELKQICSMCSDYEPGSERWVDFYKTTQAKLVHGVVSHTPAEVIKGRADADQPNMGLTNWAHDNIRKSDVTVSKNYLAEAEIKELNRLTNILLDIFEDQLDLGRLVSMDDARSLLDKQLDQLGRAVLRSGGTVSKKIADTHAHREYAKYKEAKKLARHNEADDDIAALTKEARGLPRTKR
ncbi:RhuM family protein [Aliiroseovarius lamellibrachiae]|uniref:RhuM family protein n=1 Tax=Aliiroseovarius lamellibrachiae TaxID=1924933 RepID=UPI001BDFB8A8|nr:RhuM family protein [Aliiroseovarius lamellibrachiae]MBT2131775.1 virulence RhuM family protein [Aliiroseovarius lamellibrachiae]